MIDQRHVTHRQLGQRTFELLDREEEEEVEEEDEEGQEEETGGGRGE